MYEPVDIFAYADRLFEGVLPTPPLIRLKYHHKRMRMCVANLVDNFTSNQIASSSSTKFAIDPIEYWIITATWPEQNLGQKAPTWDVGITQQRAGLGNHFVRRLEMESILAKRKRSTSRRGWRSEASSLTHSSATPSDQIPRNIKSISYAKPSYETVLATKGSFMDDSSLGITEKSESLCMFLLTAEQDIPQATLFQDHIFEASCRKIRNRNESMVIRDISLLIVPSAQTLASFGASHLDSLNESVNEGWNSSITVYGSRPQPDYAVGFGRSAFSDDQTKKLLPYVGDVTDAFTSYFMATWQMYFPFLSCEVKCGTAALDVADRQNTHSMTIAVRAIVELFRLVNREEELHREILAFSISHDHTSVRIYGHYATLDGKATRFFRHPIRKFDFTELHGREKWSTYKFVRNVYDHWMPAHHRRISSVIDELSLSPSPPELCRARFSHESQESRQSGYPKYNATSDLTEGDESNISISHEYRQDSLVEIGGSRHIGTSRKRAWDDTES